MLYGYMPLRAYVSDADATTQDCQDTIGFLASRGGSKSREIARVSYFSNSESQQAMSGNLILYLLNYHAIGVIDVWRLVLFVFLH
jgi:hypothetical protein